MRVLRFLIKGGVYLRKINQLTVSGVLIAMGVALSTFYIPIGAAKCFPIQHMVNVIGAVLLGPFYAVLIAFVTSLIRFFMGTGSLLAFPGSMFGALLAGLFFRKTRKLWVTYLGELMGTGILGGLASYPIAVFLMGKEVALFFFIIPFLISSAGGVSLAVLLLQALKKTGIYQIMGISFHKKIS